jgi:hypothetical protein
MRLITDHIVEGDSANHQLSVEVWDEPGAGGANHVYCIGGFNTATNKTDPWVGSASSAMVIFQNGPIPENGVNGVTQETLLAIVIDRLRAFQAGPFACQENADALASCEDALNLLQERTRRRIARGVEGTHQK